MENAIELDVPLIVELGEGRNWLEAHQPISTFYCYRVNKVEQNLYKISELAKKYNFEFYLLIYPWAETLQYGQEHFNWENFAYDLSKKYDFNVINVFPVFSKIKEENKYWYNKLYFFNDAHLNKSGHKIVGNYIATHLF